MDWIKFIVFGVICLIILVLLVFYALGRLRTTPGRNFLSAFENDAETAMAQLGMMLAAALAAIDQWVTTYGNLIYDQDVLTIFHALWPTKAIDAVIAGFSVVLKLLTMSRVKPLPTIAPAPIVPAVVVAAPSAATVVAGPGS